MCTGGPAGVSTPRPVRLREIVLSALLDTDTNRGTYNDPSKE